MIRRQSECNGFHDSTTDPSLPVRRHLSETTERSCREAGAGGGRDITRAEGKATRGGGRALSATPQTKHRSHSSTGTRSPLCCWHYWVSPRQSPQSSSNNPSSSHHSPSSLDSSSAHYSSSAHCDRRTLAGSSRAGRQESRQVRFHLPSWCCCSKTQLDKPIQSFQVSLIFRLPFIFPFPSRCFDGRR